jgi:hypothetical protein
VRVSRPGYPGRPAPRALATTAPRPAGTARARAESIVRSRMSSVSASRGPDDGNVEHRDVGSGGFPDRTGHGQDPCSPRPGVRRGARQDISALFDVHVRPAPRSQDGGASGTRAPGHLDRANSANAHRRDRQIRIMPLTEAESVTAAHRRRKWRNLPLAPVGPTFPRPRSDSPRPGPTFPPSPVRLPTARSDSPLPPSGSTRRRNRSNSQFDLHRRQRARRRRRALAKQRLLLAAASRLCRRCPTSSPTCRACRHRHRRSPSPAPRPRSPQW